MMLACHVENPLKKNISPGLFFISVFISKIGHILAILRAQKIDFAFFLKKNKKKRVIPRVRAHASTLPY